jgi:hypothetical protein
MKIYTKCPPSKNEAALKAWKHFVAIHNEAPKTMYKRPNCFKRKHEKSKATGWGFWVAHYGNFIDYWDPVTEGNKFRNVYDFINKNYILNEEAPKAVRKRLKIESEKTERT